MHHILDVMWPLPFMIFNLKRGWTSCVISYREIPHRCPRLEGKSKDYMRLILSKTAQRPIITFAWWSVGAGVRTASPLGWLVWCYVTEASPALQTAKSVQWENEPSNWGLNSTLLLFVHMRWRGSLEVFSSQTLSASSFCNITCSQNWSSPAMLFCYSHHCHRQSPPLSKCVAVSSMQYPQTYSTEACLQPRRNHARMWSTPYKPFIFSPYRRVLIQEHEQFLIQDDEQFRLQLPQLEPTSKQAAPRTACGTLELPLPSCMVHNTFNSSA